MNSEERQAIFDQQTGQLYAALGEFIAQFELTVFTMREALVSLWSKLGGWQSQELVRPGLAELTADPLLKVFQSSFATSITLGPLSDEEKAAGIKILNLLAAQMRVLIQKRNEIVHGTWFIGWAAPEETDFSVADGHKLVNTKSGVKYRDISRTKRQFDELSDDCNRIKDLLNRFWSTVLSGGSLRGNFVYNGKSVTLEPHQWTFKPRNCTAGPVDRGS